MSMHSVHPIKKKSVTHLKITSQGTSHKGTRTLKPTWEVGDEEAGEAHQVPVDLFGGEEEVGEDDEEVGQGEGEEA